MVKSSKSLYLAHGPFYSELRRRVDLHFTTTGRSPSDSPAMFLKTAAMFAWLGGSYLLLVFWASNVWQAVPLALGVGLAMAGIGFNVQHDGGHGSYSKRPWVNRAMALSLDVIGGSSYVWNWKHNIFHHSNPNITELDLDIDVRPFCRLAPAQQLRKAHRFQHLYIWVLYSLLAVKWHFVDDLKDMIRGRMGDQYFPRPRGWQLWSMVTGKGLFLTWVFLVPALHHALWVVALGYLLISLVTSLTLALTFQLAHCVEGASFPVLNSSQQRVGSEWAVHQIQASANFATSNRALTWYLGGLNFQIKHHLFPRVCHVHLPDLAPIIREVCREYGVAYRVYPTVVAALASHARIVYRLGQPVVATEPVAAAQMI